MGCLNSCTKSWGQAPQPQAQGRGPFTNLLPTTLAILGLKLQHGYPLASNERERASLSLMGPMGERLSLVGAMGSLSKPHPLGEG
jgi:hypothetical protein